MPATYRFTQSGACARCGNYRGSGHLLPECGNPPPTPFQRGHMRGANRDARTSSAVRSQRRLERKLIERVS